MEQDFLDEMTEESTIRNSEFPSLMEEARQRRALLSALATIQLDSSRVGEVLVEVNYPCRGCAITYMERGERNNAQ
jgi:hypothetical protein